MVTASEDENVFTKIVPDKNETQHVSDAHERDIEMNDGCHAETVQINIECELDVI